MRGLDYYTLTTFEITTTHLGAQNAVGAGGRYDGLVETLGGPKTPAVGFAVGLERTVLALPSAALPAPSKLVYVASFGLQGLPAGQRVLYDLRAIGIQSNTDIRASSLKSHLKQADRLGASLTVIIGDDEAAKGMVVVRDMTTKEQVELPLSSVANSLRTRINTA